MASFLEISNCHKNRFGKVSPCVCIESVILIIYPQSVLLCLMSDDFSENLFPLTKKPPYKYIFENSFQVNSFLDQFYIYNYAQHLIDCNFLIIYILSHRKKKKKALTILHNSEICWHDNAIHLYLQIYHAIVNIAYATTSSRGPSTAYKSTTPELYGKKSNSVLLQSGVSLICETI